MNEAKGLLTEESIRLLHLEITQTEQQIAAMEAQLLVFIEDAQTQVLQFVNEQEDLLADYNAEATALVDYYVGEMRRLVDDFETRLSKHLQALSPDATHNGALDPAASFTVVEAPYRPLLNRWTTAARCTTRSGAYLGTQPLWAGVYPATTYRDDNSYAVGYLALGLTIPPATGDRTIRKTVWLPASQTG